MNSRALGLDRGHTRPQSSDRQAKGDFEASTGCFKSRYTHGRTGTKSPAGHLLTKLLLYKRAILPGEADRPALNDFNYNRVDHSEWAILL